MMTRKQLLKRINSLASMRARSAYTKEKALIAHDVRQAIAAGRDVDEFLCELERVGRRDYLLGEFKGAGSKSVEQRAAHATKVTGTAPMTTKLAAKRAKATA